IEGKAFLLMAYANQYEDSPVIQLLAQELIAEVNVSATGAFWEWNNWATWATTTRTTAIVANALIHAKYEGVLLPQAINWLLLAREQGTWHTAQETVWSIKTFTDWMIYTNELAGDYTYQLELDGNSLA